MYIQQLELLLHDVEYHQRRFETLKSHTYTYSYGTSPRGSISFFLKKKILNYLTTGEGENEKYVCIEIEITQHSMDRYARKD